MSDENIYHCLIDQPLMTVVIGAKCKDGIVLVADRKLTRKNGEVEWKEKIFGDLSHVLVGYTGDVEMFDIFRRCIVGDVMIERDTPNSYSLDNLLSKISKSIKTFNRIADNKPFKVLMVSHLEKPLELYHIDADGKSNKVDTGYKAIGSGKCIADMFCGALDFHNITMREFIKHGYLAIGYMNEYCPELGVGVERDHIPDIKFLYYDLREEGPSDEDKQEYKNSTNKDKLEQKRRVIQKIAKE